MQAISSFSSSTATATSSLSTNSTSNDTKGSSIFSPETAGSIASSAPSLFTVTTETAGVIA